MAISKWTGELDLTFKHDGRRTVNGKTYFQGGLKVIRPTYLNGSPHPTMFLINLGGGFVDGDRYRMAIHFEPRAHAVLTTQGATIVFKTLEDKVEQYQTFQLDNESFMEFISDPIIGYSQAKFYQANRFELSPTASMFYTDILTPGYDSEGRQFKYHYLHLKNEIYVDGKLVVFDNLKLDTQKNKVTDMGYMEGFTHMASCFYISPGVDQKVVEAVQEVVTPYMNEQCRVGVTLLPTHGLTFRILAYSTDVIQRVIHAVHQFVMENYHEEDAQFLRKY
ncbi:TPA: urease accessory protein UreD [Staphylococcus delphini]|nr:urease accessory protein UreD [Staphylococcus delphini]HEC2181104.1 urease accessory protein UreD [Staphylococcus delphini]HEC2198497.1 urease accessory protein UreD [Staphylococcus delphini]